ncbi:hypothetical protein CJU74_04515 [Pseudomonas fragi]|nr:hypothetical protein CJU74_04515 [Pseudomonas fragi]
MDIKGCFGSDSSRSQKSVLYLYMPGLSLDVAGQRTFEVVLTVAVGGLGQLVDSLIFVLGCH